ncbi:MAG: glucose inhibited division protein [Rickettsiales bacterium]|jgi:16S rRNA (guanine527-N7)-methyltransferase|nr:glucose inhibited division protein [Rickettsiales bacterium]
MQPPKIPPTVKAQIDKYISENVSRETFERLDQYVVDLLQWNQSINLIGKNTEVMIWDRHILDSAQLLSHIPEHTRIITDIGSGAGLPGMVLAILGNFLEVHLVESDRRKALFLEAVAPLGGDTRVIVHKSRAEILGASATWESDVITARACAPLTTLLELISPFIEGKQKKCLSLLLKGSSVEKELEEAARKWNILSYDAHPSITHDEGRILAIQEFHLRSKTS